jgi:hypothetical protein
LNALKCFFLTVLVALSLHTPASAEGLAHQRGPSDTTRTASASAPAGARVSGGRTEQGPDADWVPAAAAGFLVLFFATLFGMKALKTRRENKARQE